MRRAVFDGEGQFMLYASDEYIAAGMRRGELEEDDEGAVRIIPKPVRALTPEEKRRQVLARERAKK